MTNRWKMVICIGIGVALTPSDRPVFQLIAAMVGMGFLVAALIYGAKWI